MKSKAPTLEEYDSTFSKQEMHYRTAILVSDGLVVRATKVYTKTPGSVILTDTWCYRACISTQNGDHLLHVTHEKLTGDHTAAEVAHDVLVQFQGKRDKNEKMDPDQWGVGTVS